VGLDRGAAGRLHRAVCIRGRTLLSVSLALRGSVLLSCVVMVADVQRRCVSAGKKCLYNACALLTTCCTSQHRYSVCEHGNSQTLIDHLQPLLQQYGAHYLSGHDHCMEALSDRGVSYFVSGMGDTCCYEASETDGVPEGALLWQTSRGNKARGTIGGFTSISATAESAKVAFYDQDGNTLYTAPELLPRKLPLA
jgi:hypothetical protein